MFAIFKKEFLGFFSSFLGVGIMVILFIAIGLFTWVFEGNLLDFGFAEMSIFFDIIPWFFLLFIPSLTMRLFAEEKENSSIDLLKILPISSEKVVLSKVLGAFGVVGVILVPTFLYVFSIKQLAVSNEIDYSIVIGQYLSILFLCFTFVQISSLASLFTNKQSIAFVLSIVCNYLFWEGSMQLKAIVTINMIDLDFFALKSHFKSISVGVIRVSELLFFVGLNLLLYKLEVLKFDQK